jgi:hypothetical protein
VEWEKKHEENLATAAHYREINAELEHPPGNMASYKHSESFERRPKNNGYYGQTEES